MATKERRKAPPGVPAYHRLTEEKRIIIETLRKEGCSNRHIAETVGCSPATIGREVKRNLGKKGYRHKKAQGKAKYRAARFPENAEIAEAVEKLKSAREKHNRFKERHDGAMHLQHRFRSAPPR